MQPVVLAIDPGRTSGFAIFDGDKLIDAGVATTAKGRFRIVGHVRSDYSDRLVVVGESWQGRAIKERSNVKTVTGIGAAWGRWAEQLEMVGHPARRTLRVQANDWRRAILGGRAYRTTEAWKAAAVAFARLRWPDRAATWEASPDAAEATLLGLYATRAPEVLAVVPKTRAG